MDNLTKLKFQVAFKLLYGHVMESVDKLDEAAKPGLSNALEDSFYNVEKFLIEDCLLLKGGD